MVPSLRVTLVGNPNCGKTTLFNALTGARQKVGNWPGVTVERKTGTFKTNQHAIELIDLPGIYALNPATESALDEKIASEYLAKESYDLVINVVDASHLERNLFLTTQLREMGVPMIIVLNMMDVAKRRGLSINIDALSQKLGVPVIPFVGHKKKGRQNLVELLDGLPQTKPFTLDYPKVVEKSFNQSASRWAQLCELEHTQTDDEFDLLIADTRYAFAAAVNQAALTPSSNKVHWTDRLDQWILNRFLGVPIFLLVMYFLFEFSITLGGAIQPLFDNTSQLIFIEGVRVIGQHFAWPESLIVLAADGLGLGVNTVLTFIPQIAFLWVFLILLERSGYMARAAFVIDRLMQSLGLPGHAFVPLIVGFGCNIPAIMAARTLEHERDRLLAIMMTPFMSCGARLAIFAVFAGAFFPSGGAPIVFGLYLIGVLVAIFTGLVLKNTLLKGQTAPFMLSLPPYHLPNIWEILVEVSRRVRRFVWRAGKMILPICVILGGAEHFSGERDTSVLARFAQGVTPIFSPMGIEQDNWPATVGLLTGIVAKEVVVGTLNTLYTPPTTEIDESTFDLWGGLLEALEETWDNITSLGFDHLLHPFSANAAEVHMSGTAMGNMVAAFGSPSSAFVYMLFVLLYVPCVSTVGAAVKEASLRWAILSVVWSTAVAYVISVVTYQLIHIQSHVTSSLLWILTLTSGLILLIKGMAHYHKRSLK